MMVDYKAIADAIPATEMNAALAELAIERPLIKKEYVSKDVLVRGRVKKLFMPVLDTNGKQKTKPVLDGNNNPMTAKGKFMDDILIKAAFNAIKDNSGFSDLRVGYVQNAIQKRAEGLI